MFGLEQIKKDIFAVSTEHNEKQYAGVLLSDETKSIKHGSLSQLIDFCITGNKRLVRTYPKKSNKPPKLGQKAKSIKQSKTSKPEKTNGYVTRNAKDRPKSRNIEKPKSKDIEKTKSKDTEKQKNSKPRKSIDDVTKILLRKNDSCKPHLCKLRRKTLTVYSRKDMIKIGINLFRHDKFNPNQMMLAYRNG